MAIECNIEKYIKKTSHYINYCEAIMDKEGNVCDAVPSHERYLLHMLQKRGEADIANQMPFSASPVHWMVEHSGCISLWTDFALADEITDAQKYSLQRLQESGRIKNKYIIYIKKEKSVCSARTEKEIKEAALKRKTLLLQNGKLESFEKEKR